MLQPIYTIHGFNWFDRRGVEGAGFERVLRTLLTNNLPGLLPDLGASPGHVGNNCSRTRDRFKVRISFFITVLGLLNTRLKQRCQRLGQRVIGVELARRLVKEWLGYIVDTV